MSASGPESGHEAVLQAVAEGRAGRLTEAEALLREVLDTDPQQAEAWFVHGQLQEMRQQPEQAAQAYVRALELAPQLAEAHAALGRLYLARTDHRRAIECFRKALDLGLGHPQLMMAYSLNPMKLRVAYGDALLRDGAKRDALAIYQSLLDEYPGQPDLLYKMGDIHLRSSRFDEAHRCFSAGIEAAPDHVPLRTAEVRLLYLEKRYDEAMERLRPLLDAAPEDPGVALTYARLCHRCDECRHAIERLESLAHSDRIQARQKSAIGFELGRLYDAAGEYDQAFAHYRRANELKRRGYDRAGADAEVSSIIERYSRERLAAATRAPNEDEHPVFIVGMPRSGTSLVEQILACHPAVYGAGELSEITDLTRDFRRQPLDVFTLDQMATRYLDRLTGLSAGERFVTDKMPSNFFHLGLISLLFPRARIIHCRRDARDTCLSCYFRDFSGPHPYTNDFESLAAYYRNYRRLMAHWKNVIDLPMLEVDYEALVQDQEAETRRMLAFLDLPWDAGCLRFYDNPRATVTASHDQVSQPIYASAIGRWQHYEHHIAPLLDAIPEAGQASSPP